MADQALDKVKKAMKDLEQNKSRVKGNGNRHDPKDAKTSSDAEHGQTDVKKAGKKAIPPNSTKKP